MDEREKVMRGAECCTKDVCDPYSCEECPYLGHKPTKKGCITVMLEDALALLKAQEPRVLEFLEISETTTYWMEDNRESNQKTTCIPETIMDIMGDRIFTIPVVKLLNGYAPVISKNREGYGKTWRAWTSRPTPEQMRDTPWEGEKDAE